MLWKERMCSSVLQQDKVQEGTKDGHSAEFIFMSTEIETLRGFSHS